MAGEQRQTRKIPEIDLLELGSYLEGKLGGILGALARGALESQFNPKTLVTYADVRDLLVDNLKRVGYTYVESKSMTGEYAFERKGEVRMIKVCISGSSPQRVMVRGLDSSL